MKLFEAFIYSFFILFLVSCSHTNDVDELQKIKKGERILEMKAFDKALKYFVSIDASSFSDDSKAVLFRNISKSYSQLGQIDSAKIYCEKAVNIADKNSFIYFITKAEFELFNHQASNAIETLVNAEKKHPESEEVANLFSLIYSGEYGEGYFDLQKAEKYAVHAFRLKNNNSNKEQLGSIYFDAEKYKLATKIFKEMYYQESNNHFYKFYYGQSLFFEGKEKKGFQLMKSAADNNDSCKLMFDEIFSN